MTSHESDDDVELWDHNSLEFPTSQLPEIDPQVTRNPKRQKTRHHESRLDDEIIMAEDEDRRDEKNDEDESDDSDDPNHSEGGSDSDEDLEEGYQTDDHDQDFEPVTRPDVDVDDGQEAQDDGDDTSMDEDDTSVDEDDMSEDEDDMSVDEDDDEDDSEGDDQENKVRGKAYSGPAYSRDGQKVWAKHKAYRATPGDPLKFYGISNGHGKIGIRFRDKIGNIPPRPSQQNRIYKHINPLPIDLAINPANMTSTSNSPAQSGLEELELLSGLCSFPDELSKALKHKISLEGFIPSTSVQAPPKNTRNADQVEGPEKIVAHRRLDENQPPLSNIHKIFDHITVHACSKGLIKASEPIQKTGLRVMTMCSGTESPLVAMNLVRDSLASFENGFDLRMEHLASAEIVAMKQAWIERNFGPKQIFRDVTDFTAHQRDPTNKELYPVTAYGSRSKPEKDVHMLIAGPSCVDYSSLNKNKETGGSQGNGESARTFAGIVAYAKTYKPVLLIVENVSSAPWADIREIWNKVGYACVSVTVDTLNYCLPQTRKRGYLFGVNKKAARRAGFKINAALQQWVLEMSEFQRRASSPYTDFALKEDDPRLFVAKHLEEHVSEKQSSTAWEACKQRHVKLRAEQKLGNAHPYTNRGEDPTPKLPDHAWQNWANTETKRVLDYLDVHHLQGVVHKDFDSRYKHRNINISQNADRNHDSSQWGVVGAITPNGSLADTRRGGPITGLEVFSMQGFPVGDLDLGKNTSKNLQDLAGNAMTTTVVGAAILSALLACQKGAISKKGVNILEGCTERYLAKQTKKLAKQSRKVKVASNPKSKKLVKQSRKVKGASNPSSKKLARMQDSLPESTVKEVFPQESDASLGLICQEAAEFQPLCLCAGLDRRSKAGIVYCPECHYACCRKCSRETHGLSGLVEHLSESDSAARPVAREFIASLTKALPPVLHLRLGSPAKLGQLFQNAHFHAAQMDISRTLEHDLHYQGIKFEGSWLVLYESETCRLELDFVSKRKTCDPCSMHAKSGKTRLHLDVEPMWLLFAKVEEKVAVNNEARKVLQHPVARMKPSKTFFDGIWELWDGPVKSVPVQITGGGTEIPTWEQKLGLICEPFSSLMAYSELEIACLTQVHPDSSAILDKLAGKYKLLQDCPAANATLHRKIDSSSSDNEPIYLFLMPEPLGEGRLDQMVFSTQAQSRALHDDRTILAKLDAPWRPIVGPELGKGMEVGCELMDQWSPCAALSLEAPESKNTIRIQYHNPATDPEKAKSCSFSSILQSVNLNGDSKAQKMLRTRRDFNILLEKKPEALKDLPWIAAYANNSPHLGKSWQSIEHLIEMECKGCNPARPPIRWVVIGKKVQAIEVPAAAGRYEHDLKLRPKAAFAQLRKSADGNMLDIRVNIPTLAHRALGALSNSCADGSRLPSLQWRLVRYRPYAPYPQFGPFEIASNGNDKIDHAKYRKEATRVRRELWKSQRLVLAWMDRQEQNPPPWEVLSLVEACLPALEYGLETKALLSFQVRGGIIADEVGAGKTATSLALTALDYYRRQSATSLSVEDEPAPKGKLDSQATLILVPEKLQKQWEKELTDLLPWRKLFPGQSRKGPYYIVANSTAILQKFSHQEIQEATIILSSWTVFNANAYWKILKNIACSPCLPGKPGRAFQEWLKTVITALDNCFEGHSDPGQLKKDFWKQWNISRNTTRDFDQFEGFLSRASQKARIAADKKAGAMTAKPKTAKAASKPQKSPQTAERALKNELEKFEKQAKGKIPVLFHMFRFRRLVVDEFSYLPGKVLLALTQLHATRRWLLSGTPPIRTYDDVNTMAKLLRTQVASYDEKDGLFAFGADAKSMSADKSRAQDFLSQTELASAGYKEQVYDQASQFLRKFARKNEPSGYRPPKESELRPVNLSVTERVVYNDAVPLAQDPNRIFNKPDPSKKRIKKAKKEEPGKEEASQETADKEGTNQEKASKEDTSEAESSEAEPSEDESGEEEASKEEASKEEPSEEEASKKATDKTSSKKRVIRQPTHPASIERLTDLIEQAAGPEAALITSGLMIEQLRPFEKDQERKATDQEILNHLEFKRLEAIIEEQQDFVRSVSNKLLQAFSILCGLDMLCELPGNAVSFYRLIEDVKDENLIYTGASAIVAQLLSYAKDHPLLLAKMPKKPAKSDFLSKVAEVQGHIEVLMSSLQRMRFLNSVHWCFDGTFILENCSACLQKLDRASAVVSSGCGHLLCRQCVADERPCCASFGGVVGTKLFRPVAPAACALVAPHMVMSTRMRAALALVSEAVEGGERVLAFAQYKGMKDSFVAACAQGAIACFDGFGDESADGKKAVSAAVAAKIEGFQAAASGVLVLKLDSVDAAGWNLQCASRVLFLAPLVAASAEKRSSDMEQAVGRCWRPGQNAPVVLVHLLGASETIETKMAEEAVAGLLRAG